MVIKRCVRGDELGIVQEKFAFTIGAFVAGLRGVGAAMIFEIEFAVPNGRAIFFFEFAGEDFKKCFNAGLFDLWQRREIFHHFDIFKHLACGTAAAIAEAICHEQVLVQIFLLEVLPRAKRFFGVCHGVIGAGKRTAKFLDRAEVGEDLRAVNALPHKGVIRQAVVLTPTDLDGHEIFQVPPADELRQRPCITEDIGQPQHRSLCILAEMFAEECATEKKLPCQ